MKYILLICAAMLVSGPAFADGKGKDKDKDKDEQKKEQKETGKSDKKSEKDDKDEKGKSGEKGKSDDDHGKSGEKGKSDDDHEKSGEKGKSDDDHGKSGEEHGEKDSPEGGEDEGAAPVDNLTAQKNELEKHNRRMAKIARLETLGSEQSAPNLTEKAKMLREKENRRHEKAMKRLKAKAEQEEQE